MEEVESALITYTQEQQRRKALKAGLNAAELAAQLAKNQYQAGLVDFINVLETQRTLLSFEDNLALSDGTITSNLVRIYKALGGGWASPAITQTCENQKQRNDQQ